MCGLNLFMHTVDRKVSGSAFQRVGPARENERRPYVQGCNGGPLTTRGQQIVRRDAARTV